MNRVIKSVAIGVALGCAVLWCVPNFAVAQAPSGLGHGEYVTEMSCVTGGAATWGSSNIVAAGGACGGRLSSEALKSGIATIPFGMGFAVVVNCDKGLAADGDSCIIVVETRASVSGPAGSTARRAWSYLGCATSTGDSTDYPMTFWIQPDLDSVNQLGSIPLAAVDGGGATFRYRGQSLGEVRVSLNGPQGDSTADGVGRWPIKFIW